MNPGRAALGVVAIALAMTVEVAHAATRAEGPRLLPLGSQAPDFRLPDVVSGTLVSRDDFAGKKALLVMFICRHCPYVQHVTGGLAKLGKDYAGADLGIVAISANDPAAYPQDAPEGLKEMAQEAGVAFPYLYDASQEVAKAYTAVVTPDFFLCDAARRLVYRGQFDDSRPGNRTPVTGGDLRAAIDAVLEGTAVPQEQTASFGTQ